MSEPQRQHVAALAAVYLDALNRIDEAETALHACLDLFDRLEAITPGRTVTEDTIRQIMRAAADHVLSGVPVRGDE